MQAIKAVYDGDNFFPKEPIPVKGQYDVIITFINPIKTEAPKAVRPSFQYNSAAGDMWMADDFNDPVDDFKEYMQ